MTWIQTHTGRKVEPLAPQPSTICIEDIAHALSMKCRFTGHCKVFYSLAEHSCHVARMLIQLNAHYQTVRRGLMHDAAEAYLPDIASPIKSKFAALVHHGCGEVEDFDTVEQRLLRAIGTAMGISGLGDDPVEGDKQQQLIHLADKTLLATEARDLFATPPPSQWTDLPKPLPTHFTQVQPPPVAEAMFLQMCRAYKIPQIQLVPISGAPTRNGRVHR